MVTFTIVFYPNLSGYFVRYALDFECVTTGGKGRMISTVAMPAIFLVSKSREGILVLFYLFLKEQRQRVPAHFLRPVSETLSECSCYLSREPVRMLIAFLHRTPCQVSGMLDFLGQGCRKQR